MIIIVEGPDNVGKGTQIENIKKWIGETGESVHVLHYSNIKVDKDRILEVSKMHYRHMFEIVDVGRSYGMNFILDRAHLGEAVYSPIYRGYNGDYVFNLEKDYCIAQTVDGPEKTHLWKNTKLILYTDDPENLIDREDGKSFSIDLHNKESELKAFEVAFNKSILDKIMINISGRDKENVWNITRQFLRDDQDPFDEDK
jgi:hypothetical protein